MKNVVEDEKQDPCGNDCEAAIQSVAETKVAPEDEARGAEDKQQKSDCENDPRSPGDVSGSRVV